MDFSSYLFSCLIKIMLYLFGGHPGDAYYFCNIQFFNVTQCKHQLLFGRQISCETENQILQFLIDQSFFYVFLRLPIKSCNSLLTKASSMFSSDFQFSFAGAKSDEKAEGERCSTRKRS